MRKKIFSETRERTLSPVIGKHVFGNLYDVEDNYLKDLDFVKKTVTEAASIGNMHIVDVLARQFDSLDSPDVGGVSVIALILESHISIHTWPEARYMTVDIYSCGKDSRPGVAFDYILSIFKPKSYKMYTADRSYTKPRTN